MDREYPPPDFDTGSYCRSIDRDFILQPEFCDDRVLAAAGLPFSAREASPTSGSGPVVHRLISRRHTAVGDLADFQDASAEHTDSSSPTILKPVVSDEG